MEFFDIFIFNNVKSDLKIILCQPNKVVFKGMSQGRGINIMTFNSYRLQYYSFEKQNSLYAVALMSQGRVIDIMIIDGSYSLQYYSFWKGKMVLDSWCGGKWSVAVVGLDGSGRESERFGLKGESLRKKYYLCLRYWRATTDWTDMLRNWWTGIGRNMHVADCNPGKLNGYVPEYVGNHDAAEDAAVICTL